MLRPVGRNERGGVENEGWRTSVTLQRDVAYHCRVCLSTIVAAYHHEVSKSSFDTSLANVTCFQLLMNKSKRRHLLTVINKGTSSCSFYQGDDLSVILFLFILDTSGRLDQVAFGLIGY